MQRNTASSSNKRKRERSPYSSGVALIVADGRRVRSEQFTAYQARRQELERHEKSLRRFRESDAPRFSKWVSEEFAELLRASSELEVAVSELGARVQNVLNYACCRGLDERAAFWALERARAAGTEEALWDEAIRRDAASETASRRDDDEADESSERESAAEAPPSRLKSVYRQIVRILHPDRIADPSAFDRRAWQDAQEAYRLGDVERLERLFVAVKLGQAPPVDGARIPIEDLLALRRDTERALQALKAELRKAKANPAWGFQALLKDRWRLSVLRARIAEELSSEIAELERQRERHERKLASWYRSRPPRKPI